MQPEQERSTEALTWHLQKTPRIDAPPNDHAPQKIKNKKIRPKGAKIYPSPGACAKYRGIHPDRAKMSPEVALGSRMAITRQIDMHIGESGNGFKIRVFPETQVALGPNGQQKTPRRP